ncbi:uncharacterized [Tachysurus ichikawai]
MLKRKATAEKAKLDVSMEMLKYKQEAAAAITEAEALEAAITNANNQSNAATPNLILQQPYIHGVKMFICRTAVLKPTILLQCTIADLSTLEATQLQFNAKPQNYRA